MVLTPFRYLFPYKSLFIVQSVYKHGQRKNQRQTSTSFPYSHTPLPPKVSPVSFNPLLSFNLKCTYSETSQSVKIGLLTDTNETGIIGEYFTNISTYETL